MSEPAGRVIAIGDIHGYPAALDAVLRALEPTPADTLVFLGDYADRGPDSRGVLERLIELRRRLPIVTILGNHDEMLLAARTHPRILADWLDFGGDATLRSYGVDHAQDLPAEHVEMLSSCVDFYATDRYLFAHGSYDPELPLEEQPWNLLRWESIRDGPPAAHSSGRTAILGHTSQKDGQILDLGHLVCIDTYAYGGGWLTAYEPQTGRTWQADRQGRLCPDPPQLPPR
ncbi:MAG: serine/threonine protein phosphatase [Isosphaeraceae bacterium]|jgi:serine/threonine protein phosphatase 1|nr:MAG: serine/threonine protein phosphatase [Isosphaeraceae bacterium]